MDACGASFPQAHLDAQAMAEMALAGHEIVGFDTVMPEFSVQLEAEALGSRVDRGHRDMSPDAKTAPYENFSDIQIPENLLEKRSMRMVLDALSIPRRQVGGKVAIVGKVMGPWMPDAGPIFLEIRIQPSLSRLGFLGSRLCLAPEESDLNPRKPGW